jgi:hypothetical protein
MREMREMRERRGDWGTWKLGDLGTGGTGLLGSELKRGNGEMTTKTINATNENHYFLPDHAVRG